MPVYHGLANCEDDFEKTRAWDRLGDDDETKRYRRDNGCFVKKR